MPDGRAATVSSKRTGIVGLIVPTISNSIYAEFTEAIQSTLQKAGLSLLIANANYSADIERDIIHKFIENRVEGVILTGYERNDALYRCCDTIGFRSSLPGRQVEAIDSRHFVRQYDRCCRPLTVQLGHHQLA